ncbi:hypothetical protein HK101_001212 [Irineochytrium annulatum]|nr:hypothetical protein HK101_001212 [Irineochytrium annulatum]
MSTRVTRAVHEASMASDYNSSSHTQLEALKRSLALIEREFARAVAQFKDAERLTVADFGCSHGANSIPVLEAMLRLAGKKPIDFYLIDLPSNDWATTADALKKVADEAGASIIKFEDVENPPATAATRFILTGRSFHDQILKDNTLHFGFSATAMHWLSSKPEARGFGVGGDLLFRALPADDPHRVEWTKLQANDWDRILIARQAELAPGAGIVIGIPAANPGDDTLRQHPNQFPALTAMEMEDRGEVTREQANAIVLNVFSRSKEEMERPFSEGVVEKLELVSLDIEIIEAPEYATLGRKNSEAFADALMKNIKAYSTSCWKAGGVPDTIIGRILTAYRAHIVANAEEHRYRWWQGLVVIHKKI